MDRRETVATSTVRSEPVEADTRPQVLSRTLAALRALDTSPVDATPSPARWLAGVGFRDGVKHGWFVLDLGHYGEVLGPTPELGLIVGEALAWLTEDA